MGHLLASQHAKRMAKFKREGFHYIDLPRFPLPEIRELRQIRRENPAKIEQILSVLRNLG